MALINLYLDDVRLTPPGEWVRAYTATEAISVFMTYPAELIGKVSLDHDLGICESCFDNGAVCASMNRCLCFCHKTGYDVVCWMEENNYWPKDRPTVHSANPVGRQKMLAAIERAYRERT